VIGALIVALLAGFLGRLLMPGRTPGGFLFTLALGFAGSFLGYFLFTELLGIGDSRALDLGGLPGAVIGAMLLLWFGRKLKS
jgi:uncharacterized membrane protein YeaQ/YmgE (transglycosylase-associated protein family)